MVLWLAVRGVSSQQGVVASGEGRVLPAGCSVYGARALCGGYWQYITFARQPPNNGPTAVERTTMYATTMYSESGPDP